MKIIDLLNKIANGEQPKTIKYYDTIYNFEEYKGDWGYVNKQYGKYKWFAKEIDCDLSNCLNDEVEIIEKEPRNIKVCGSFFTKSEYNKLAKTEEDKKIEKIPNDFHFTGCEEELANKINEIIDYLMENKQ